MPLQAILLDMDGTLSETEGIHQVAFNQAFAEAGLDWQWDDTTYRRLLAVKGGQARILHYLNELNTVPEADRQPTAARLHRMKRDLFLDACRGYATLRPGVARLIAEARAQGIQLALVTAATSATVTPLLATLPGIEADHFDTLITGDRVAHNKPAPDLYELALSTLNVPAHASVAIEDCDKGLEAARRAGITTVVTMSEFSPTGPFDDAVVVVSDLGEPDRPCQVVAGRPLPNGMIDVETLTRYCTKHS